jgi:suppressor for copper-sensitivity B
MLTFLRSVVYTLAVVCLTSQVTKIHASEEPPIKVSLISSVSTTGGQGTLLLGVKFQLPRGWKIYAPPPNGTDPFHRYPQFSWKISPKMPAPTLTWPKPKSFQEMTGLSYGYDRDVILPLTLDPTTPGLPLTITGELTFLACADQCVPMHRTLSLSLPGGPSAPTPDAPEILGALTGHGDRTAPDNSSHTLWFMMLFAFLGGLILNAMPCVLPVLSLKVRHFLTLKPSKDLYQKSLLYTALGILVSFWILALAAIILKKAGQVVGWGLHFQSPVFLIGMAALLFVFARALWDEDGFALPPSLQNALYALLGTHHAKYQLFYEHFFSGIFATLLATPCTAPFLGTALGYALAQGPLEITLLFTLMGIGFATPYFLLLMVPPGKLPLPKPGPWMEYFSRTFSVAMALTALWLLWVFAHHVDTLKALLVISALVLGLVTLFAHALWRGFPYVGKALLVGAFAATFFWHQPPHALDALDKLWQPFDEAKIAPALAEGKVVLVDVTASWCATCQVNKILVMRSAQVQEALKNPNVLALRADWTLHSDTITRYLARFNRAGIPFNVVYGPKNPEGLVLPELLRKEDVLNALKQEK